MATKTRATSSSRSPGSSDSEPDRATAYAVGVVDGSIIAGPHVRAACTRHLKDLEEGPGRGLDWRPAVAARLFRYFRSVLRLAGGEHEGNPFHLQPWQAFVVGSLFGWHGADGYRRFRQAFIETAKGSGKSPLAAGIGMYMLHADQEPRAEVYAAATKKDQAQVLFRDAVAMVQQSPRLKDHLTTSGGNPIWNLAHLESGSFFRPISSDDGQSGPRPHCALLDEIHEHKNSVVVDMLRAGTKGRRQALLFGITNSGTDRQSICFTLHEYGTKVAAGQLEDDSFFAYICAMDEGEDPLTDAPDPELGYPRSWAKANPSIGVTFPPKYLEEQVREARGMPAKESVVRRLNFCEWVDAVNPWIDGDLWRACERESVAAPEAEEAVYLALDLGEKRDLAAAAHLVKGADGLLRGKLRFWTPKDTMEERERMDRVPYSAWVRAGHVNAVPGRSMDFSYIVAGLADWLIAAKALAFDQWHIDNFLRALDNAGIAAWIWDPPDRVTGSGLKLVRHGQGWGGGAVELDARGQPLPKKTLWMPKSIGVLEDAVVSGRLEVERNPCLTWNSASAVIERDAAGNGKFEKRKSTGRIDGLVALCQAVGLADQPVARPPSYGILILGAK